MKKKILIISIIALIVTLIGSTYAFFMYSKTTKAFTLTSGDINIEFVNGDNNINLTYAYPISDNFAKTNLEKLGYVDFSVNGKITEDKKVINYEIYLEEDSKNTLDSNYIKVYLTDDTNKEIVSPTTYNSLDKTTYSNSENGKVIYKTFKKGEFNDKYRIYVWLDSKYTQNVIQERFSFKVNLYAYNDNETAVSVIKSNLVKYVDSSKDTFTGGLVAVNTDGELYDETDSSESIREYRYSGLSVDNYVTFNDETWRIIGVFKDEKGSEHVKIVRNEMLEVNIFPEIYMVDGISYIIRDTAGGDYIYWNYTSNGMNYSDWNKSGLQFWLNSEGDTEGYLKMISSEYQEMIECTKYYLGNVVAYEENGLALTDTIQTYNHERGNTRCSNSCSGGDVWNDYSSEWNGKIGFLYPSDIGYSVNKSYWNTIKLKEYSSTEAWNNSWLKKIVNDYEWLISPTANNINRGSDLYPNGYFGSSNPSSNRNKVRPALYIKSNVKIISGDGTFENPYNLTY